MMFMSAYIPCSSPTQQSQKLMGTGHHHKLLAPAFPFGLYGPGDLLPHPLMVPDMFYPLPLPTGLHPHTNHSNSGKKEEPSKQDPEKLNFGIDRILETEKEKSNNTGTGKQSPKASNMSSSKANKMADILPATILPPQFTLPSVHLGLSSPYSFSTQSHTVHNVFESSHSEQPSRAQCPPKRKRSWSRAVFSALQRKGLEKRFEVQKYVTKPDRRQLAAVLGLTDAQVKVWFQNRRMKWRHMEEQRKKQQLAAQTRQVAHTKAANKKDGQTEEQMTEVHVRVTDSEVESESEAA